MKHRTTKAAAHLTLNKTELSALVSLVRQGDHTMHPCSPHALSKRGETVAPDVIASLELTLDDLKSKQA